MKIGSVMRAIFLTSLSVLLGASALAAGCLSADQVELVIVSTEPVAGAPAPGTCAEDRAVGVSLPFVHREGGYSIPIQVGCADELGRTLSQPIEARLAAGLETAADGTAVLAGGVPSIALRTNVEVTELIVDINAL
jgi:X-X-X-Leu-X-X-Gly heptad repeat protein